MVTAEKVVTADPMLAHIMSILLTVVTAVTVVLAEKVAMVEMDVLQGLVVLLALVELVVLVQLKHGAFSNNSTIQVLKEKLLQI